MQLAVYLKLLDGELMLFLEQVAIEVLGLPAVRAPLMDSVQTQLVWLV